MVEVSIEGVEDVLKDFELTPTQREAKQEALNLQEDGIDFTEVEREREKRRATASKREDELFARHEKLRELVEEWEERKEEDDFKFNKRKNAHDHEDVEHLEEVINLYEEMWPDAILWGWINKNLEENMFDVLDQWRRLTDEHRKSAEAFVEKLREDVKPALDRVKQLENVDIEETAKLKNELREKQQHIERLEEKLENQEDREIAGEIGGGNSSTGPKPQKKKKIKRLKNENPDMTHAEIAGEIDASRNYVTKVLNE